MKKKLDMDILADVEKGLGILEEVSAAWRTYGREMYERSNNKAREVDELLEAGRKAVVEVETNEQLILLSYVLRLLVDRMIHDFKEGV